MKERQEGREKITAAEAWSGSEATAFDRHLQEELGLPGPVLMENAGSALAIEALQLLAEKGLNKIVLFCGPGNNGGDALVAARHLAGTGPQIEIRLPLPLGGSKQAAVERLLTHLPQIRLVLVGAALVPQRDLLVDGLFGLGLSRPLEGVARTTVERMNECGATILAVDLPSGLHADTGEALGAAVRAVRTLTFVAPKRGMFRGRGPECCGVLRVAGIGVSAAYSADWLRRRRATATD